MSNLTREIARVEGDVDLIHCDVMDGHFVPNLTFGPPVIKAIKRVSRGIPLDVHLMIERPLDWIGRFLDAGLGEGDFLTFHVETQDDPSTGLEQIRRAGVGAGLSMKPKTEWGSVQGFIGRLNLILVMTVEPGFGGQTFMPEMLKKVSALRESFGEGLVIGVDGGIDANTAPLAQAAGADLLVAGKAIFGEPSPCEAAKRIRQSCSVA